MKVKIKKDVTKIKQKLKYFLHTLKGLPRLSRGVSPLPTDHCSRAWVGGPAGARKQRLFLENAAVGVGSSSCPHRDEPVHT